MMIGLVDVGGLDDEPPELPLEQAASPAVKMAAVMPTDKNRAR
jgi:hypothetical protein